MKIPVDKLTRAFKMGASVKKDSDTPVRVSVYLDSSASRFLAETVRDAFVPQTTSGIVRVERLGEERIAPKTDTDVVLVLSCGSDRLEIAVQELVIAGAPVCVLAESAVEVPFIEESTPMLGVVAATDKTYLLETLARWILDRTDKETAFAANFAFMRIAAANRIITSCALTNMATGALVFLPGADYPVMALAQVGMLFELAAVFGRGIKPERGYEVAGVLAGGLVIRAVTRALVKQTPHIGFAVKALTAAAGTYGMGRALVSLYERDVDYSRANEVVTATFSRVRDLVTTVAGATRPMASYQDASDLAVIAGAPVCVLAESAVEVPFIEESTPMLGVVAATDKTYLLETLARWILDRTDKETAFAANFAFMRIAAANRIITSCALTNMATGALVFLPGADYPVMALAQVGMLFELAAVFGRGIKPERGYEVAGVLAGGLVIRAVTRALVKQTPHIGFAVKALTAAAGTYGMGRALVSLYERDVDYSRANEVVTATFSRVRDLVTTVAGATRPMASYQDASDLAA